MKSFPKILIIFFLTAFIVQLGCLILLLALPQSSRAADIKFTPQISGLDYKFDATDKTTGNIARYVRAIYNYGIGIIGILAAVVLMIGGVLWIVAGGNATQIGEAKSWIGAALTGLVLALTSYLILNTINPALVNLQITKIPGVSEMKTEDSASCCQYLVQIDTNDVFGGTQVWRCENNLNKTKCDSLPGKIYQTNGKCNNNQCVGGVTVGSCTYANGTVCENNFTLEKCKSLNGTFIDNKKCSTSCCDYKENVFSSRQCQEGLSREDCGKGATGLVHYFPKGDGKVCKQRDGANICELE